MTGRDPKTCVYLFGNKICSEFKYDGNNVFFKEYRQASFEACKLCPIGYYSDAESSSSCKMCVDDTRENFIGAFGVGSKECVRKSNTRYIFFFDGFVLVVIKKNKKQKN